MKTRKPITALLVTAQFLGTSLWFVGNVVIPRHPGLQAADETAVGFALSAVQIGFIMGTMLIAIFNLADRIKGSRLFFLSCVVGSVMNLVLLLENISAPVLVASRLLVGLSLAGIYPIGIKIISDYYRDGLGKALGYLVGALVLGTALPHLLSAYGFSVDIGFVTWATSLLALLGGLAVLLFVPKGPFEKRSSRFQLDKIFKVFKNRELLGAASGYFGHMWELYAFWGFLPFFISEYFKIPVSDDQVALLSFVTIAAGSLACVLAGNLSSSWGSYRTARFNLKVSGVFCLISPCFYLAPAPVFIGLMLVWGAVVVADSAQFSTLVAINSKAENRGTAITLVNCLGFAITVVSIQLLGFLAELIPASYLFLILGIGPLCGILLSRKKENEPK